MYSTSYNKMAAWLARMDRQDKKINKAVDKATKALQKIDRYLEQPKSK